MKFQNLKALLLFIVLVVAFTWPLTPHMATHYPSTLWYEGGDPNLYISVMNLVAQKAANWHFHPSQMIYYPAGMNFLAGYEAPLIFVVSTPVILVSHNPILAYNIILLLAFVLTCYAAYALIRYLTKSYFAALIAGGSFGLSPYMMVRGTQHLDLLLLFCVPFSILLGFKFVENPNCRNAILLALSVLIASLTAWYYLLGILIFLGLLFLFNIRKAEPYKKQYLFAMILVFFAVAIPALPMFIYRNPDSFKYVSYLVDTRGADPLNFFIPHPYMQPWTGNIYNYFISPYEATSYYGIIGIIAILVLVLMRRRIVIPYRRLWITTIILFIVIAMGNYFSAFHHQIKLPFYYLSRFLPFDRLRAPNRFFIFSYLGVTVVFGYFLAYMRNWFQKISGLAMFTIPLLALLCAERMIIPYPVIQLSVPKFYMDIGQDNSNYAIADIPFVDPGLSIYNFYQIYHKKPIADGEYFWTAYNYDTFDFARSNALLVNSVPTLNDIRPPAPVDAKLALKQLAYANIKYVVVHNLILHADKDEALTAFIHNFFRDQKSVYADGAITVYSTSPE
ncbi:MAG TPA: hypothetical protein VFX17_00680 [Patescibacteria group bacterium]|nr:hypothetical protein [Patescibacteria group bacterium]